MKVPVRPGTVSPVTLEALRERVGGRIEGDSTAAVTGLTLSSSSVQAGDLYAALAGARTHGANFAQEALQSGACAVLTDPAGAEQVRPLGLPLLVVDEPRRVLGATAAAVYGFPAARLTLVAVTGTSGKTTTTQLMVGGLRAASRRSAVVGTMGTWVDDVAVASTLTTPEAPELHALFAVMVERGVEVCALEVSSHALVLGRVDGVVFDLAVFTNLGRDHLDFHVDVESYFAAKADLFTPQRARRALVVVDDEHGRRLARHPGVEMRTLTSGAGDADWQVTTLDADELGSTFELTGPRGQRVTGSVPLPGAFNVVNAACALASLAEVGVDLTAAAEGVASAPAVAGRMERVACGQPFTVVVDYAHKPDAVAAALQALRPVTEGRLLVVLGAGGDRDRGKRRLMGEIAARLADVVVVTDDNPRSEDPAVIRAELVAGANAAAAEAMVLDVADRRAAILRALVEARPGDAVLIAGKGHETGQEVDGRVLPFDDRAVARSLLAEIVAAGASR